MTMDRVQKLLGFEDGKEIQRRDRIERLLSRLGQPPDKLGTAAQFDYDEATRIAQGKPESKHSDSYT